MKQILAKITVAVASAALVAGSMFSAVGTAQAYSVTTNSLIKASGPAVYWYASNGQRYCFPNEKTYYSWFPDFKSVQTISDAELASIQLAGNVTYRPGYKLIKINTDPKVYAVERYSVLRWVTSPELAASLYGYNWSQKVEDLPDVFFTNYTVGAPIYSLNDYNVGNAYTSAINPTFNMGLGNDATYNGYNTYTNTYNSYPYNYTNYNTTNYVNSVSLTVSNRIVSGNTETVSVTASIPAGQQATSMYVFDQNTKEIVVNCTGSANCVATLVSNTYTSRNLIARAFKTDGTYVESSVLYVAYGLQTVTPVVYPTYPTYPVYTQPVQTVTQPFTGTVTVIADKSSVIGGQDKPTYTATVSGYNTNVQNLTVRLYTETDGTTPFQTCTGFDACVGAAAGYAVNQPTTQRVYAVVSNEAGQQLSRVYAPDVTLLPVPCVDPIVVNPASGAFTGSLSILADKTEINVGDTITLTAKLTNSSVSADQVTIDIRNLDTDELVYSCTGFDTCVGVATANATSIFYDSVAYKVEARDNQGRELDGENMYIIIPLVGTTYYGSMY